MNAQAIYQPLANAAATAAGIPQQLFSALITQESSWNPDALGTSGDYGLTQLIPSTAQSLGVNQYDPAQNLQGGATLLAQLYKQYANWTDALSAYNTGLPASQSSTGAAYANKILTAAGMSPSGTASSASGTNATSFNWLTTGVVYIVAIAAMIGVTYFAVGALFKEGTPSK